LLHAMMVVKPVQAETAEVWAEAIGESLERTKAGLISLVGKQQVECRTGSTGPIYCLRGVS
jgi:predicted metalloprotease